MNIPDLNFELNGPSYFLWRRGATILGKLQAIEALDFLIDHLDLNDGFFSASMVHQPAVHGVEAMGSVAVPKLSLAVQHHMNRNIRLAAALCLVDIGGQAAMEALRAALHSESDSCVRRFIELSLEKPGTGIEAPELLRQRLMAFRCDN